jgi:hypothetical protein
MSKSIPVVVPETNVHTNVPIIGTVTPIVLNENISVTNNMRKIYAMRKTLMLLCFIDIFFSFVYALNDINMLIPLLFAVCGYYGVKNYKLMNTYFYIIYELITIIGRIILFIYFVSIGTIFNPFFTTMLILSSIIGFWVLELLYKYTKLLKNLQNEELHLLKNMGHIPSAYTIYY